MRTWVKICFPAASSPQWTKPAWRSGLVPCPPACQPCSDTLAALPSLTLQVCSHLGPPPSFCVQSGSPRWDTGLSVQALVSEGASRHTPQSSPTYPWLLQPLPSEHLSPTICRHFQNVNPTKAGTLSAFPRCVPSTRNVAGPSSTLDKDLRNERMASTRSAVEGRD